MTGDVHEWTQWIHKSMVLNQNRLPHWGTKNKIVKDLKVLGKVAGKQLRRRFGKVRLEVTVSYPVAWDADASNYYPTMKAYVDGMVDKPPTVKGQKQLPSRGILIDDSDKFFDGPHLTGSGERSGRKDFFRFDCRLKVLE
ncbi:RusA-like resolvase [Arthrobacter phage Beagle]|nr:RusA-like resolvase [Arthrobacter phage Beagle]